MRTIDEIIIHCSATEQNKDFDREDIYRWHTARGWSDIGYHYIITLDGTVQRGRPIDEIGAHAKGHNKNSIGVCYIGGLKDGKPHDTRTENQRLTLIQLLSFLRVTFPNAKIIGHRDVSGKACPSFDATNEYKEI